VTPPRAARWLVDRRLPRGPEGDTIRGDLLEEFDARAARSTAGARWWYWRVALSILFRYHVRPETIRRGGRQAWYDAVGHDLQYAVRLFRRTPGFSAVVLVTLALGIGANTAIFSALNAVLLTPLPYPHPDRLVRLVAFNPPQGINSSNVSAADSFDWRRDARTLEGVAVFYTFSTNARGRTADEPAERIAAAGVVDLFAVLGVSPATGRGFSPQDAHPGPATAAIVSDRFWQRRFGGDAKIVGRPLRPGAPAVLVGVMPPAFAYPEHVDLWIPAVLDPAADSRANRMYEAIARLRPGVTIAAAQAELDAISVRLDAAYPDTNRGWRVRVVPLVDYVVGDARRTLVLLFGAVALVLLVACANVANLFLAQGTARQREIAIRLAIGAGRGRVFAQVLTESLLLSTLAGACGIAIGRWGLSLLVAIGGTGIPRLQDATLDRTVLLFAITMSYASGIVFGVLPALQLARVDGAATLRDGGVRGGTRILGRRAIVVAEVAIALVLLAAAGLVGRSFAALQRVDVGFEPRNLLTFRVSLAGPRYRQAGGDVVFFDELSRRLDAIPGVQASGAVLSLPLGGGGFYLGRGFIRPGRAHPPEGTSAGFQYVTPTYFRALGVSILRGREFDAHDGPSSPQVAIVNRTFAERFFAGENPLGQSIHVWRDEPAPRQIVGVVADLKPADLSRPAGSEIFVPLAQGGFNDMTMVVRTADAPASYAAAARQAVQAIDPMQAAFDVKTFDAILRDALAERLFGTALFAAFAALALVLAAVGLYGVMAQLVTGRMHELGVRLALGARPSEVRGLVVRQALGLLALGVFIGLPLAVLTARLLGTLLFGIGPGDPLTLLAVVAVLGIAASVAAYLPARRATRVDAARVLRS
jgi:putative ABC transport system permease protein